MKEFKDIIIKEAEKTIEAEPYLRLGQTCYNLTHNLFPEIVNSLRGTALDCFNDDSKIDLFLNRVEKRVTECTAEMEILMTEIETDRIIDVEIPLTNYEELLKQKEDFFNEESK